MKPRIVRIPSSLSRISRALTSRAVSSGAPTLARNAAKMAVFAIALALVTTLVACSAQSPESSDAIDYLPSSDVSDTDASTPQRCGGSKFKCGADCVDLSSSNTHCGTCDTACGAGETCDQGACKASVTGCPTGTVECNGQCVDTQSDVANCGSCTNACGDLQMCIAGQCSVGCAAGSVQCGSTCVDPVSNADHCGATPGCGVTGGSAGTKCDAQSACISGSCYAQCSGDTLYCASSGCVDAKTDNDNCGGCGNSCGAGKACSSGLCCSVDQTACMGACKDLTSDHNSCGSCGHSCSDSEQCVNSECVPE